MTSEEWRGFEGKVQLEITFHYNPVDRSWFDPVTDIIKTIESINLGTTQHWTIVDNVKVLLIARKNSNDDESFYPKSR